jgi:protein required for attachment to host cells
MKTLWVLVANNSNAKIFCIKNLGKDIQKVHELEHPDSRKKGSEILTDRPGRAYDRFGVGRHAVGKDPLMHEHQVFAQELGEVLRKGFDQGSYEEVALIASPQFLGIIRQCLPDPVKKIVGTEVDKDIVSSSSEAECINLMCRYLNLWNH